MQSRFVPLFVILMLILLHFINFFVLNTAVWIPIAETHNQFQMFTKTKISIRISVGSLKITCSNFKVKFCSTMYISNGEMD